MPGCIRIYHWIYHSVCLRLPVLQLLPHSLFPILCHANTERMPCPVWPSMTQYENTRCRDRRIEILNRITPTFIKARPSPCPVDSQALLPDHSATQCIRESPCSTAWLHNHSHCSSAHLPQLSCINLPAHAPAVFTVSIVSSTIGSPEYREECWEESNRLRIIKSLTGCPPASACTLHQPPQ